MHVLLLLIHAYIYMSNNNNTHVLLLLDVLQHIYMYYVYSPFLVDLEPAYTDSCKAYTDSCVSCVVCQGQERQLRQSRTVASRVKDKSVSYG